MVYQILSPKNLPNLEINVVELLRLQLLLGWELVTVNEGLFYFKQFANNEQFPLNEDEKKSIEIIEQMILK